MTDYVEVKPLRTFDNGSGLKTVESEPFKVERGEANELKALGLVSFEDGKKPEEAPAETVAEPKVEAVQEPEPAPATEPEPEPEPKYTRRKPKADNDK